MRNLLAAVLMALAACHPQPVPPEPAPGPVPVAGAPCERACARLRLMGCPGSGANCGAACERYEAEAELVPALSWQPECIAGAPTCDAADRCRSGQ